MVKNQVWLVLVLAVALATAYYLTIGVQSLLYYSNTGTSAQPIELTWNYRKIGSDTYAPVAAFSFFHQQAAVKGETQLSRPLFRNAAAADQVLRDLEQQEWSVWYNPKNTKQATIERRFPIKDTLSAITMLGLLVYFIFLGYYVQRKG